jgi:LL-diaminopimelate aminotransferase
MFEEANRMQGLTSAIFTQVDNLRKAEVAAGKDVITLSIGSPDMAPAPHIIEALKQSVIVVSITVIPYQKGILNF